MNAVAHNPAFAKKAGVPQSVGKDFSTADKGRVFKKGGDTMSTKSMKALFAGKESKSEEKAEKQAFPTKAGYKKAEAKFEGEKMAKGGSVFRKTADGIAKKGKTKATQIAMKKGGKC